MTYDVIVVGGGPAGLSGAVALGRALRSVLVVDAGEPRNAPAEGIHNYLTRDGMTPAEFAAAGRAEVRRYGGDVLDGRVVSAAADAGGGFTVRLADGSTRRARRLLITTGLTDVMPAIPGLRERWGRTVLHCPYCHGYEVRGRAIGVLGTGPMAVEKALLWRQWSPDVTLFDENARDERLTAAGIRVIGEPVTAIADDGVHLAGGTVVPRDALVVTTRMVAEPLPGLGLETTEQPFGVSVATVDPTGLTTVPGVWVAGNAADLMGQVVTSAGAGLTAAAAINVDLVAEDYRPAAASSR
jgi:thioredoxin reductase